MLKITVTKGSELIITLNNHNFLFNYSHSTQWKLSFPPDFFAYIFNFEELQLQQQQQKKNLKDFQDVCFSLLMPSTKCT